MIVGVGIQERFVCFGVMMHQRWCAIEFAGNFAVGPAAFLQDCRERNAHINQFSPTYLSAELFLSLSEILVDMQIFM